MLIGAKRRRIVSDFVAAGGTSPMMAIAYDPADAATFKRLLGYGAIVADSDDRFHLDVMRLGAFRGAVRRRAAAIAATTGLIASATAAMMVFALAE